MAETYGSLLFLDFMFIYLIGIYLTTTFKLFQRIYSNISVRYATCELKLKTFTNYCVINVASSSYQGQKTCMQLYKNTSQEQK